MPMHYKLDLWSKYGFDLKRLLLPQLPLDRHLNSERIDGFVTKTTAPGGLVIPLIYKSIPKYMFANV